MKDPNEISNCPVVFDWMPQVPRSVNQIGVAPTCPDAFDITSFFKVRDNILDCPFRNPNHPRYVANSNR